MRDKNMWLNLHDIASWYADDIANMYDACGDYDLTIWIWYDDNATWDYVYGDDCV